MTQDVIVAIFDSVHHAQEATDDLIVNHVPSSKAKLYVYDPRKTVDQALCAENEMHRRWGFWSWLIGDRESRDVDHRRHHELYDGTIALGEDGDGRAVIAVTPCGKVSPARMMDVLRSHKPLDIVLRPDVVSPVVVPDEMFTGIDEVDGMVRVDIGTMGHVSVFSEARPKY